MLVGYDQPQIILLFYEYRGSVVFLFFFWGGGGGVKRAIGKVRLLSLFVVLYIHIFYFYLNSG